MLLDKQRIFSQRKRECLCADCPGKLLLILRSVSDYARDEILYLTKIHSFFCYQLCYWTHKDFFHCKSVSVYALRARDRASGGPSERESLCAAKDRNLYLTKNLVLFCFLLYYRVNKEFSQRKSVSVYALKAGNRPRRSLGAWVIMRWGVTGDSFPDRRA